MSQKDMRTIHAELARPFAPEDLAWRLQKTAETGKWGISRTLYSMDTVFVGTEKQGRIWVIKNSDRGKLDNAYLNTLTPAHWHTI